MPAYPAMERPSSDTLQHFAVPSRPWLQDTQPQCQRQHGLRHACEYADGVVDLPQEGAWQQPCQRENAGLRRVQPAQEHILQSIYSNMLAKRHACSRSAGLPAMSWLAYLCVCTGRRSCRSHTMSVPPASLRKHGAAHVSWPDHRPKTAASLLHAARKAVNLSPGVQQVLQRVVQQGLHIRAMPPQHKVWVWRRRECLSHG